MTPGLWLVAVLMVLAGFVAAPYLVVLVAVEVVAFAVICGALGWLLASGPGGRLAAGKAASG